MTRNTTRWWISNCWKGAALVAFWTMDAATLRRWIYPATVALVPSVVSMSLWRDQPRAPIAAALQRTATRS